MSTNSTTLTVPTPKRKITTTQFIWTHSLLVIGLGITYFEGWGILALVFYQAHMFLDVHQSEVQVTVRPVEPPTAAGERRRSRRILLFWVGIVVAICLVGKFIPLSWFHHSDPNVARFETLSRIWRHPITIVVTWSFVFSYLGVMWKSRVDHGGGSVAE